MAIEIVNCPMKIDIFKSYVRLPEGISIIRTYHRDITADTMIKVFRSTGRQLSEWPRFVFFLRSKCPNAPQEYQNWMVKKYYGKFDSLILQSSAISDILPYDS